MNYKRQALYNTVGNLVYLLSLWLISVLTVRLSGFEAAGVFSLAMSIGNIFYFIAVYGMRSFQASDSVYQYAPRDYILLRGITTAASLVLLLGYLALAGYSVYVSLAIFIYSVYRFFEAYSDVFFGELQRVGHLEVCGVSMSCKGVLSVLAFALVFGKTQNLNWALLAMSAVACAALFLYDIRGYKKYRNRAVDQPAHPPMELLKAGFPMLLTTLFPIIVTAVPRLALERCWGEAVLGAYSSVSAPTVLITSIVPNVLAAFMTLFGLCYHRGEYQRLLKMLGIVLLCTAAFGLAACAVAFFLGDPVMSLIFGEAIRPHLYLLIPLILATTVYALSMAANSILISIRQPFWLTLCAASALVTSLAISYPLVRAFGEMGAVWAFGVPFAVQLVLQIAVLTVKLGFSLPRQTGAR